MGNALMAALVLAGTALVALTALAAVLFLAAGLVERTAEVLGRIRL